jgi:hypothetical protein
LTYNPHRGYNDKLFERRSAYALFAQAAEEENSETQAQEEDARQPPQEEESLRRLQG